jgi:hypothetical protein
LDDEAIARRFDVDVLFTVVEFAALPTEPGALSSLVVGLPAELGTPRAAGQVFGLWATLRDNAVAALFGATVQDVTEDAFMTRSVAPSAVERRLQAALDAHDGVLWPLDDL